MTKLLWLALAVLPACGNTYHPEYHPVNSVRFQQTLSYPVSVHPSPGQQVIVAPSPVQGAQLPTMPPLSPPPAEMDPARMW